MAWVKRNLYFVISCVVAIALLGAAGWYCYSGWQGNSQSMDAFNQANSQMTTIVGKPVTPTQENIDAARNQAKQARELADGLRKHLLPIASIPNTNKIDNHGLAIAFSDTIRELTMSANDNHVALPQDFAFSFSAQRDKAAFTESSWSHLARQLGEIKVLCDILFANRINSLDTLQRERTADDATGGTQPDYVDWTSVTNNNTIISPYQVSFQCFDQELAGVLSAFANEQYGIMVRTMEVVPAEMTPTQGGMMPTPENQRGFPPPPGVNPTTLPKQGGLPIVADDKKLRVTMLLELVRIVPTPGR